MQLRNWISVSRFSFATVLSCALAACGGGGGGGSSGGFTPAGGNVCDPGTDVQLANPAPLATGVPTNIGSITIVANGNSNQLYSSYQSWNVILQGNFGSVNGGSLNLVSDPNGPHPFPSDFYFSSSVPALPGGQTFQVLLVNNTGFCGDAQIGSFST